MNKVFEYAGFGLFRIYPRFHNTSSLWNLEYTRKSDLCEIVGGFFISFYFLYGVISTYFCFPYDLLFYYSEAFHVASCSTLSNSEYAWIIPCFGLPIWLNISLLHFSLYVWISLCFNLPITLNILRFCLSHMTKYPWLKTSHNKIGYSCFTLLHAKYEVWIAEGLHETNGRVKSLCNYRLRCCISYGPNILFLYD